MNAVFSHQSLSSQEHDIIIIDGVKSEFTGTEQQIQASRLLHPSMNMFDSSIINRLHPDSKCAIYLGKNNELLIISNLATKDNKGRAISYSFYFREALNSYEILSTLDKYCQMSGTSICETDKKIIKEVLFLKKNRYYLYGGLAIMLFAICKAIF